MGILASWLQVFKFRTTIQCCILFPVIVQLSTQIMEHTVTNDDYSQSNSKENERSHSTVHHTMAENVYSLV